VCRRVYNTLSAPSKDGRHCDDHPETELRQRADDTEATVRRRLQVYRDQTSPLVIYYRKLGALKEIESIGALEQVYGALTQVVAG
jgi:adenylate kinase